MVSDSIKKDILDAFPSSSKKDWIRVASKELNAENPVEKLGKFNQGLTTSPYYDAHDPVNALFQLSVSSDRYKNNRAWENLSMVPVSESVTANREALLALQSGADGILFSLEEASFSESLLKKIQWQHCSLRFTARNGQEGFFSSLNSFISKQHLDPETLPGSVFWKSAPNDPLALLDRFKKFEKFQCLGIFLEQNESRQKMIADALVQATRLIDTATRNNIPPSQVLPQLAFAVHVGTDFFLEIATLKTLRKLWYQISSAYDPSEARAVHIHAHSTAFTNPEFQAHANMIKSPVAALASITGGCDSLSIEPEDCKTAMPSRIARNVSSILLEESHLGLVADPTAGSYYIESLTDQLSQSSWKLFQERVAL